MDDCLTCQRTRAQVLPLECCNERDQLEICSHEYAVLSCGSGNLGDSFSPNSWTVMLGWRMNRILGLERCIFR